MSPTPSLAHPPLASSTVLKGILFAAAGVSLYSVNDMAIKHLSSGYALHQLTLIRSSVGLVVVLLALALSERGFAQLRTSRPFSHLFRCGIILLSNVSFYIGLAAMPMADAAAVAYTSPLILTALSVVFLKEKVGPRRWAAVGIGLLGTLILLRPSEGMIQPAALLVLISAALYAVGNLMSRHMRGTESTMTQAFYMCWAFITASAMMGLFFGDGTHATVDPLWSFLFRAWIWPPLQDWPWLVLTGTTVTIGAMFVAQAYRSAEAAIIAPFDYIGMPLAILWGVLIFGTWPDLIAWAGIALICGSGIYVAWREASLSKKV